MTTPEEHAIHVLLEEQLGGLEPPDVTAGVIAECERRRQRGPAVWWRSWFPSARSEPGRHWSREVWAWLAVSLLLAIALVGCALVVGSTGAAPFIYTMF